MKHLYPTVQFRAWKCNTLFNCFIIWTTPTCSLISQTCWIVSFLGFCVAGAYIGISWGNLFGIIACQFLTVILQGPIFKTASDEAHDTPLLPFNTDLDKRRRALRSPAVTSGALSPRIRRGQSLGVSPCSCITSVFLLTSLSQVHPLRWVQNRLF